MGFVGPVSRLGGKLVRPHDVTIALEPGDGRIEAMVKRVVHLGFEVRLELELPDGSEARAQLTRAQADELELGRGDIVYARPPAGRADRTRHCGGRSAASRSQAQAEVPAARLRGVGVAAAACARRSATISAVGRNGSAMDDPSRRDSAAPSSPSTSATSSGAGRAPRRCRAPLGGAARDRRRRIRGGW